MLSYSKEYWNEWFNKLKDLYYDGQMDSYIKDESDEDKTEFIKFYNDVCVIKRLYSNEVWVRVETNAKYDRENDTRSDISIELKQFEISDKRGRM